jgi:hypothetical protein
MFGRIEAPDVRDHSYPMMLATAELPSKLPDWTLWPMQLPVLDQGNTATCVGHGWWNFLRCAPDELVPDFSPRDLYRRIVLVDEWAANDGEATAPDSQLQFGTSVRAGAKALQDLGLLATYLWAFDVETIVRFLAFKGPVVIGVDWTEGMMQADRKKFIHYSGRLRGGHCTLLRAVHVPRRLVMVTNSWGRRFGHWGDAWLSWSDLGALLRRGGEACTAVQQSLPQLLEGKEVTTA